MNKQSLEQKMQELRDSDPWMEFANLDTRGLPSFQDAVVEEMEGKPDPFEQVDALQTTNAAKHGLRNFLQNPDNDTIRDAARMPGADASLVAEHYDRLAEAEAQEFRRRVPDYPQYDENFEAIAQWLCQEGLHYTPNLPVEKLVELLQRDGFWTADNLEIAYNRLYESGELPVYPDGAARALSAETLTQMQRLCSMGQILDAVALGLRKTFDLAPFENLDAVMLDPAKTPVVSEIVLFCWKSAQADYDSREDSAFTSFVYSFAGERGLTIPICQSAWAAYKEQRKSILRDKALGIIHEPEPERFEPRDFDRLDDASLESLRLAVMKEKNRSRK
jgi:hypothetical protein